MASYAQPRGKARKKKTVATPSQQYDDSTGRRDTPEREFKSVLTAAITDAIQYIDGELSPARAKATDYYKSRPFGNEEEGRSQFVIPEVRNAIRGAIPDLVEVVFGPELPLRFLPDVPEATEAAKVATEAIASIFIEQNAGFLSTYAVWKDAFLKKLGAYKVWWDATETQKAEEATGLTEQQVQILGLDPTIELTAVTRSGIIPTEPEPTILFDVQYLRTTSKGKIRVEAIPPEELIFSRNARGPDDAMFIGHRRELTISELIALGYDENEVKQHAGTDDLDSNVEVISRNPNAMTVGDSLTGDLGKKALYIEGYLKWDSSTGPELRKVCTVGSGYHILHNSLADDRPFMVFCPDPEPHTLVGDSLADITMPFQRLKSAVIRTGLDASVLSLFPRTAADINTVNFDDLKNTDLGAPIRTDGPPGDKILPFKHNDPSPTLIPLMSLVGEEIERATGQPKGVITLDMDALQSTEKAAAQAAMRAGKAQSQLYARLFCEGTLKPLFRRILKLLVQHQDQEMPMYLKEKWQLVDPRSWNADWQMSVKVALGSAERQERIGALAGIVEKQEMAMQTGGLITDPLRHRNALAELTELAGLPNVDAYWATPQEIQQRQAMMAQSPPPPSPEMVLAENEVAKTANAKEKDEAALQLEATELQSEQAIKAAELQQKTALELEKLASDERIALAKIESDERIARMKLEMDAVDSQADRDAKLELAEKTKDAKATKIVMPDGAAEPLKAVADGIVPAMQAMIEQMQSLSTQLTAGLQKVSQPKVMIQPQKQPRHIRVERGADGKMTGLTITATEQAS